MKNTFAELLSEVISNSEISKNEMIRECDIDRSSFFKFLSGTRIPTTEQFNRICNKLQFSPSEEKMLRMEYAKITQGEQKVSTGNRITELLWKLEDSNNIDSDLLDFTENRDKEKTTDSEDSVVYGKQKVFELLKSTIVNQALSSDRKTEIDMFLPERTEEFFKWMTGFLESDLSRKVRIRHLFELPSRSINTEQMLMDMLRFALLGTAANSKAYFGYYYYAYNSISNCVGVLYPYSLVTETRVVLLNERMDKAIIIADPDFSCDYRDYFMIALNSAKPIIRKVKEQEIRKELNQPIRFRYGGQGYLELPGNEKAAIYVSTGSVRRFAETGCFEGDSESKFLKTEERISLLNKVQKQIGSNVFLIDERSIPAAESWEIMISGKDKLIINSRKAECYFVVTESSIVEAFYNFMENLPNSGNLLRTDLAKEIFDDILACI